MKATFDLHSLRERLGARPQERLKAAVILLSFVIVSGAVVFSNQYNSLVNRIRFSDFEVGKVASQDLVSDRNLAYVDHRATTANADALAARVPPVFRVQSDIVGRSNRQFAAFADLLTSMASKQMPVDPAYKEVQAKFRDLFTRNEVAALLENRNLVNILPIAGQTLENVMSQGIVALQDNEFNSMPATISLIRYRDGRREPEEIQLEAAHTLRSLPIHLRATLGPRDLGDQDIRAIVLLVTKFAREDAFYDFGATQRSRDHARAEAAPVMKRIVKGERLLRKGFVITQADMDKVRALGAVSIALNTRNIIGSVLFVAILYLLGLTLLSRPIVGRQIPDKHVYLLIGLALFYVIVAVALTRSPLVPEWLATAAVLPSALVAMIVSILVDRRAGVIFSLLVGLSLFLLRETPYSFLFAFLSGTVATFLVSGAERRIDLVRASIELAAANAIILVIFGFLLNYDLSWFFIAAGLGALNGFLCGMLVLGLLPVFEHLLNAPTPFRLMELSDMNSPLLRRMLTLAPGTYGHSVSVANLAESACRAIGANALLARVGAYYHDIGKIDQSEYFIENQTEGNKHDDLKPSLSAAVIKSHVKIGIERAKELGLPQEVIDIIAQHHGSGLISYFYIRALKNQKDGRVNPEDFSYTGSPPGSREAAVVMLADGVEAASRTLKKPTVAKLERFIWSSIMDKFTSGQMNESDLTFKDLETIKKTFVQILAGHFHSRIEYPDKKEAMK